jgi:cellulose synthase/poly-beta-1,6-N-acetylglucosamine synthase-like glycosyltransferase
MKINSKSKKVYKVSVGIPALNEGKTIGKILDSVLNQNQEGWVMKEILVYSDGSVDGTVNEAKKRDKKIVKVKEFVKRMGKSYRLNQIFREFAGDILVLFDADVKIADKSVITNLVNKFKISDDVMLVGGDSRVFPPTNFFEKAIYTSYYVYYKSREKIKGGDNAFACTGACYALKRVFAKEIIIPKEVLSDDLYVYLSCIKAGYKFKYASKSKVYYKMAANLKDFLRQMFRSHPEAVNLVYKKYFGDLIDEEYYRPRLFYLRAVLESFIKNPLGTIYMIGIKLLAKPFYPIFSKKYKLEWFTALSTKG